ncbi:MAG: M48 family metalloprotease [Daejeonella sp.]
MKKLVLFLFLCWQAAAAQEKVNQCGIIIPPPSLTSNFLNVYEAGGYIRSILDSINWKANFTIQERNGINNAYATIINNRRFIVYDNRFLTNLDEYARTNWASVSVLAHEMGHHYRNHIVSGGSSSPPKELEADYFSGYALAKLGASLNEATAAMQRISPLQGSASHPGRAARVDAIQKGWDYAKGISTTATSRPRSPVPQPQQNPPPPANEAGWIHLSVYGNHSMTVYLSDDGRNYSPVLLQPTQPFVFKYEIYNYGFLRLTNSSAAMTYKLMHNKDYSIIWNRRTNNWTVVQVP